MHLRYNRPANCIELYSNIECASFFLKRLATITNGCYYQIHDCINICNFVIFSSTVAMTIQHKYCNARRQPMLVISSYNVPIAPRSIYFSNYFKYKKSFCLIRQTSTWSFCLSILASPTIIIFYRFRAALSSVQDAAFSSCTQQCSLIVEVWLQEGLSSIEWIQINKTRRQLNWRVVTSQSL